MGDSRRVKPEQSFKIHDEDRRSTTDGKKTIKNKLSVIVQSPYFRTDPTEKSTPESRQRHHINAGGVGLPAQQKKKIAARALSVRANVPETVVC